MKTILETFRSNETDNLFNDNAIYKQAWYSVWYFNVSIDIFFPSAFDNEMKL